MPSPISKSSIPLNYLDTDEALTANSDVKVPSQQAVKAYADTKAPIANPTFTGTVGGVTKAMVGLTNVDDTSDATKNAASVALTNKDISSPTNVLGSWINLGACTYEGADAPTYTISFASDMTAILGVGMRIKLTDSTVKYFIITAVGAYSGGKTIITLYGGTDYTLSGGAITAPAYSMFKAPAGFPLSPAKWTETYSSASEFTTGSPTQNTWYNAFSKSLPIGVWEIQYHVLLYGYSSGAASTWQRAVTLSTANNSENDANWTSFLVTYEHDYMQNLMSKNGLLTLAAKTTYYLNYRTTTASLASLEIDGRGTPALLRAVCAYL